MMSTQLPVKGLPKFLLLFWLMLGGGLYAQQTVTGRISASRDGAPLSGATVQVKGTTSGVFTDENGLYEITVPGPDAVLIISYVGFERTEVQVNGRTNIDLSLNVTESTLDEVVVVGYGTVKKSDATGAMNSVTEKDFNVGAIASPEQLFQGRAPGVVVTTANGEPGGAVNVRIRGGTSISASNEPLYVIDGVPLDNGRTNTEGPAEVDGVNQGQQNPLNFLNPNDIETIDILKDASATAIYGSRGANGVIIITTKSGAVGKPTVSYDGYAAVANATNLIELLDGNEFRQALDTYNLTGVTQDANTDWQDEILQTAWTQSHSVSFGAGASNRNYRASISYFNQDGIVLNSNLERATGRLNVRHTAVDDRLDLNLNLTGAYTDSRTPPYQQTGGFTGGLFNNVFKFNPTFPVLDPSGVNPITGSEYTEISNDSRNPVALAEQIDDRSFDSRLLANFSADLEIFESLHLKTNLGLNYSTGNRDIYQPSNSSVANTVNGLAFKSNQTRGSKLIEVFLDYDNYWGEKSHFKFLAGYSYQDFTNKNFTVTRRDFTTDFFQTNNLEAGADGSVNPTSLKETNTLVSVFGRINYDWANKYFLTATFRADGSSRFGENNKWGYFPSAAFMWKMSEEPFLEDSEVLTGLNLRVGWGITGNQEIGNYNSLPLLGVQNITTAILGGIVIPGFTGVDNPNPDLQWEETQQFNAGIDYDLWSGRLYGSMDFYTKTTSELLLRVQALPPRYATTILRNVGEVYNIGYEMSINAVAISRPNFQWTIGFNFNYNHNEVLSITTASEDDNAQIFIGNISGAGLSDQFAQVIQKGDPLGAFYGLVYTGPAEDSTQTFEDLDGNGIIDDNDRTVIGSAQPDWTYGLNLQFNFWNFDVSAFFRGVLGADVFNNTALEARSLSRLPSQNIIKEALNDGLKPSEAPTYSSFWVEDASFLRMDNASIGYNFDVNNISWISRLRLYVGGQNLFLITDYTGYDPEVNTDNVNQTNPNDIPGLGIDYTNYPRARTFLFGAGLTF
ncbi:TonB-dependent receptor [Pontibacter sp. G13]|uniref:SusC/RagA family TonB-linked outer membrane protein n=1 Tax=Pontibacter sp. G13 TaxID=3074898 RepID=UPI00288BD95F|nr:TonB-dependent receptor [Pontibacter sp. G13]WNJ19658.1 TonB-dependent receptor [Pontibacter sp. G13]